MKGLFILLLTSISVTISAQNTLKNNRIDSVLNAFKDDYPQEKVFVQTDREAYFTGETIWMKAWCTLEGVPSYLSQILYVDLTDEQGKVVEKKMYKLDSLGSSPADIDLPISLTSGSYSLNAYTLWMLNFPSFIFRKPIYIYGSDYLKKKTNKVIDPGFQFHFFPEGGNLIEGVMNKVAFMVTDNDGQPISAKGNLVNKEGKTIAEIQTLHNGMGIFEIEPATGESYKVTIPFSNGMVRDFPLMTAEKEGVSMLVDNANPNRLAVLLFRGETNKEKYNKLRVLAQMNAQTIASADLNFEEGLTALPVSKKNLPAGIMHITAFTEDGLPVAERLVFIANHAIIKPNVDLTGLQTGSRKKNEFYFSLDTLKLPAVAVAVTDASFDTTIKVSDNIVSSLLLSSDIKGYIHNPAYYFKDKAPTTLQHLDLLMMTQGWRRFEWKNLLAGTPMPISYPVESSITMRGLVKKSDRNTVVKDGFVSFIIKTEDSTTIMANAKLTDKGEFLLNDMDFKKAATIFYQGTNNKKETFIVDVDVVPSYIDSLTKSSFKPQIDMDTATVSAKAAGYARYLYGKLSFADSNNAVFLGDVEVKGVRKKLRPADSLNAVYASEIFKLGRSIDPSEVGFATTIWQIIQRTVPGISVSGDFINPVVRFNRFQGLDAMSENNSASYLNASGTGGDDFGTMMLERNGVTYFLNEVNVSMDVISTLSVSDVALIKVYAAEGSALGASGPAIAVYTKKGAVASSNVYDKRFSMVKRQGYSLTKTFFSPLYTTAKKPEEPMDDRQTLYWNGNMRADKNGKYNIKFYHNDIGKKMKLTIQGITTDGKMIFLEKILE